ncbi:MAG: MarR family winged helix-turn-helix transcriptional regulator [Mangrovibacterium sp.]
MSNLFDNCLYFRLNRLLRTLSQNADAAFAKHHLSSSHAYLLLLVNDNSGIGTVELSQELNLNPSTITRLVDKMVIQGYLRRVKEGKRCEISCTEEGSSLVIELQRTWQAFQQNMNRQITPGVYAGLNKELKALENEINTRKA